MEKTEGFPIAPPVPLYSISKWLKIGYWGLPKNFSLPLSFTPGGDGNHCSFGSGLLVSLDNFNDVQACNWAWDLLAPLYHFCFLLDACMDTEDFFFVVGDNQISVVGGVPPLYIMCNAHLTHFLKSQFQVAHLPFLKN